MRQTLEELILQHGVDHDELTVGSTRVTRPPLDGPVRPVTLHGADRLMVAPRGLPEHEAPLLLPGAGETAPAVVVADAIAATYAWEILRRFLARAVYPSLEVQRGARIVVRRGRLKLADAPAAAEMPDDEALHAAAGWIVLLQEVWGRPEWEHDRFYDVGEKPAREDRGGPEVAASALGAVEVADPLPAVVGVDGPLDVDVTLAGLPFVRVRVQPTRGTVSAQALRGAISYAAGYELCNAVVREALLLHDGPPEATLRERLAAAAARRRALDDARAATATATGLVAGWRGAARDLALDDAALLGRLRHGSLSGAAGRYTLLPGTAASDVRALAAHTGQPLKEPPSGADPDAIVHAPLLIDRAREPVELGLRSHNRARWFERRHLTGTRARPATVAEARRGHVLELVGDGPVGQVLQVGCSDPVLTAELGARAARLVAADISWLALQEAAARCADRANVSFQRTDVFEEPLPGGNDLIVVGDVLRWAERPQLLKRAARRLGEALAPGGALVITSSVARADEIWSALHSGRRLELTDEVRTATTRTQRYGRRASRRPRPLSKGPEVHRRDVELADEAQAPAGTAPPPLGGTVTGAVPVLMYHRIADDGESRAARWRTEPARFDEQLHHLAEQGFRSVDVDEWASAAALDQPLPGRRVILTFDDGFADFEAAVPILERHGFTAELFVVTGHVGGTDAWDTTWDRREPLLDWQALADLPKDVVRIGSHTVSHAALTALAHVDVVRELTESRIALEDRLGRRVTTLAYPFGLNDGAVQRIAGAVGYEVAYTTMPWWAYPTRNLLGLPRLEVRGGDPLDAFAALVDRPSR
jgi:peptidoglycan/xylan/chitin deacetylase (PgdA/CDA1 family)/2-polyprenyl-3-methyl-5-hydroxy-6-metoxy-1,4-benzoquinol methylase